MAYVGGHVWTLDTQFETNETFEYKYTLGEWDYEGANEQGQPLQNFAHTVRGAAVIEDKIDHWTSLRQREVHGQVTGIVRYHAELPGFGLRDRDILVWLPPGYATTDTRYPVLYMHDGQNLVDPTKSTFSIDWQIDETCTELIEAGKIPPLIVVGIYNTPDREQEYLPGPKSSHYIEYVASTIKPLVDLRYRTKPSREDTFVGGSSAGGVCALMMVWERSDVFSKAICMSPAFKLDNEEKQVSIDYVSHVVQSEPPAAPIAVYIDNGGVGLEATLQPGVDAMVAALREKGLVEGENLWVSLDAEGRHNEAAWAKRFPAAIQKLIGSADGRSQ